MKLQVFKNYIYDRYNILKLCIYHNIQIDLNTKTAFWDGLLGSAGFTLTYFLFLNVIFANVKTLATLNKDEMLLFTLICQINYYLLWGLTLHNSETILEDITYGNLDLTLIKPLPTLFYTLTKSIKIIPFLRQGLPVCIALSFTINWSTLYILKTNIIVGLFIMICGQLIFNACYSILGFYNFWKENTDIDNVLMTIDDSLGRTIPVNGLDNFWKFVFLCIIPVCIPSSLALLTLLGKANIIIAGMLAFIVAFIFSILKIFIWNKGLKNYNSINS